MLKFARVRPGTREDDERVTSIWADGPRRLDGRDAELTDTIGRIDVPPLKSLRLAMNTQGTSHLSDDLEDWPRWGLVLVGLVQTRDGLA